MLKGLRKLSDGDLRRLRNRLARPLKLSDQRFRALLRVRREYERRYGLNVHMPHGDKVVAWEREMCGWRCDMAQDA